MVIGYLVIGYWLLVIGYWLFGYWLLVIGMKSDFQEFNRKPKPIFIP
jgi:hypothetical protein